MAIISYQKWHDAVTSHTLTMERGVDRELCTIDGVTYCYVATLPKQVDDVPYIEVTLTPELKAAIKGKSRHVQLVNQQVRAKIAEKYSIEDEIQMLRLGNSSEEFRQYSDYVESCIAEGKAKKAKFGL